MLIPLQWLVLAFFIVLAIVFFLVYEANSKLQWKEEVTILSNKNNTLKKKLKKGKNLNDEYDQILNNLKNKLTERQFDVFLLAIYGFSSKEIGEKLNVAPTTVDWHIKDIKEKLGVEKRSQFAGILLNELKISVKNENDFKKSETSEKLKGK